ncbi:MAG: hypothetical protein B7Y12_01930 [Rhizobiales bacterium 24-66-13]|nr:MAG: hypothetical protein B7Y61_00965 [Rhizobiales bacterium 35-66-30]OYZ82775.1 MAG: hypothetical protein B7Y12_01930 [Rhizobiales bacterium 24-66-13]OZB11808.1 MAG: hypothetical protein B7X67_01910 [Rhizobiales bacterium 39-66-18]HQS09522.1 hypothetical protein [Xanthobacteraceae bacterium]HQS46820.1 hypothetical protein [Xanthobacteraceae bacterium]
MYVGPVDAPITRAAVNEAVEAGVEPGATAVDCIGFESEIGLIPQATDDAAAKGERLALRYIPKDVFDKRAVAKGQVVFYDVAYLEVSPKVKGLIANVTYFTGG